MIEINLEMHENQIHSCSLDKHAMKERLNYLHNDLFPKATAIKENGNKISLEFAFDRAIANEMLDLVFFENNCCGNFKIDLHFDMLQQTLTADLLLID